MAIDDIFFLFDNLPLSIDNGVTIYINTCAVSTDYGTKKLTVTIIPTNKIITLEYNSHNFKSNLNNLFFEIESFLESCSIEFKKEQSDRGIKYTIYSKHL